MSYYIEGGLAEFTCPTYKFENLVSATFMLRADGQKLQQVCDKFLNAPLGRNTPAEKFVPGIDKVFVTCSTFPISHTEAMPVGFARYCEIALLVSVYDRKRDEWSWYAPGLYLDGPASGDEEWQAALPISIGRELYGLPKRRAEINLDTNDYTGFLRTIGLASPGNPIKVGEITLEIRLKNAVTLSTLNAELDAAELESLEEPLGAPRSRRRRSSEDLRGLRARRDEARATLNETKRRLAEFAARAELSGQLSPQELVERIWGADPYSRVLPSDSRPDDPAEAGLPARRQARRVPVGDELYEKVGLRRAEWGYQFDYRLLGLRQLRDPGDVAAASLRQVIRTQLLFNNLPWRLLDQYEVKVDAACDIASLLGCETQTVPLDQTFVYPRWLGTTADFGAEAAIVT